LKDGFFDSMEDYIALYSKYRPQNFENVIGQDAITKTLKNSLKNKRVANAYLFCGPRGIGKTTNARILARAINCEDIEKDGNPCNKCPSCKDSLEKIFVDTIEIDAASNRRVEETNEIIGKAKFFPIRGKKKVYIIDEVHMLSKHAFNSLLKILEEPPKHVHFILATTEIAKIPDTVISRCQRFDFYRMNNNDLLNILKKITKIENAKIDDEFLMMMAKKSNGGARDAIVYLDKLIANGNFDRNSVLKTLGISDDEFYKSLWEIILKKNLKQAVLHSQKIIENGIDITTFINGFLLFLQEEIKKESISKNYDEKKIKKILSIIDIFFEASSNIKTTIIPQLPLEVAIFKSILDGGKNLNDEEIDCKHGPLTTKKKEKKIKSPTPPKPPVVKKNKINIDKIQSIWKDICKKIKNPSSKLALAQAQPTVLEGKIIILFDSEMFMSKVEKDKTIKSEILKFVDDDVEIEYRLKNVNLTKEENLKIDEIDDIFG